MAQPNPTSALEDWVLFGGNEDGTGKVVMMGTVYESYEDYKNKEYKGEDFAPNGTLGVSLTPYGTKPNTDFDKRMKSNSPLKDHKYLTNKNYQVVLNKRIWGKSPTLNKKLVQTYSHESNGHILFGLLGRSMLHGPKRSCSNKEGCENYNKDLEERIKEVQNEVGENYDKHNE